MPSNYPPGMTSNQIPGFNDVDVDRDVECGACQWSGEVVAVTDGRTESWTCPRCGVPHRTETESGEEYEPQND